MKFDVGPWEFFGEFVLKRIEEILAKKGGGGIGGGGEGSLGEAENNSNDEQLPNGAQHRNSFVWGIL